MSDWRRHAIYFAPPRASPLAAFGAAWLGWDPEAGVVPPPVALPGLPRPRDALTAAPRDYGFHATLKPPFRLAAGCDPAGLAAAAAALAAGHPRFELSLRVAMLGGFVALLADAPPPALARLADACVTRLDGFRAPPEPGERARRRAAGLDPAAEANLRRWGYPWVLDRFSFHMTLTGPLAAADRPAVARALTEALAPLLAAPVPVAEICHFAEGEDGRFRVLGRHPLG
jgi:putative phosphonate metabolism protein